MTEEDRRRLRRLAVRAGVEILHADAAFEVLAHHTDVRTHPDSLH